MPLRDEPLSDTDARRLAELCFTEDPKERRELWFTFPHNTRTEIRRKHRNKLAAMGLEGMLKNLGRYAE